jgi:hypothetical protein
LHPGDEIRFGYPEDGVVVVVHENPGGATMAKTSHPARPQASAKVSRKSSRSPSSKTIASRRLPHAMTWETAFSYPTRGVRGMGEDASVGGICREMLHDPLQRDQNTPARIALQDDRFFAHRGDIHRAIASMMPPTS